MSPHEAYAALKPMLADIERLMGQAPLRHDERAALALSVACFFSVVAARALGKDPIAAAREVSEILLDVMAKPEEAPHG